MWVISENKIPENCRAQTIDEKVPCLHCRISFCMIIRTIMRQDLTIEKRLSLVTLFLTKRPKEKIKMDKEM